ncbi:hypothetical protein STBA_42340 [Streptomyces sp. MP131-18]|nr:hypothetical protein STBA_42340 [Streptomyces sp. MP131-18]
MLEAFFITLVALVVVAGGAFTALVVMKLYQGQR